MNRLASFTLSFFFFIFGFFGFIAFGQKHKSLSIPFQSNNNLVIVEASVNGSGRRSFLLDTGAGGSVINAKRAAEIGIKLEGDVEVTTGDGGVQASFAKGVDIVVSGLKLPGMTLAAVDLSGLEAGLGQRIDGILGYDVFERYVVEFDYVSRNIKLFEPGEYEYSGSGQAISITIDDNRPFVRATVIQPGTKTMEGRFEFDTGQVGAVTLAEAFTTRNELLKSSGKTVQLTTGAILTGKSVAQTGRVEQLQLGDFRINRPVTNFVKGNRGEVDTSDYAGQIGGEILRRFRVIVDYSRKRVILEPNNRFGEPYDFDMSGMSLISSGASFNTFQVRAVVANSPATEAGLRVGDIVTAFDGKPTDKMTLSQIRQMFKRANRTYKLKLKRETSPLEVTLKTRRMI